MGQESAWEPRAQGEAREGYNPWELGERAGGLDRGHRDPEGDMRVRYNTTVCSSLSSQGQGADHAPLEQDDGGHVAGDRLAAEMLVVEDRLAAAEVLVVVASVWAWVDPQGLAKVPKGTGVVEKEALGRCVV